MGGAAIPRGWGGRIGLILGLVLLFPAAGYGWQDPGLRVLLNRGNYMPQRDWQQVRDDNGVVHRYAAIEPDSDANSMALHFESVAGFSADGVELFRHRLWARRPESYSMRVTGLLVTHKGFLATSSHLQPYAGVGAGPVWMSIDERSHGGMAGKLNVGLEATIGDVGLVLDGYYLWHNDYLFCSIVVGEPDDCGQGAVVIDRRDGEEETDIDLSGYGAYLGAYIRF